MADDKRGRDKQAHDQDRRQREREIREELARSHEPEPAFEPEELAGLELALEPLTFPASGETIVETVGDRPIAADRADLTVSDLLPDSPAETFESPEAVRMRVQRPTVAQAMKRVVEASDGHSDVELRQSQLDAYRKTFEALADIDADDEDEGITAMTDWIIERIRVKGAVPGSRSIRRQAAKFCRSNGYPVRNDDWLGI